METHLPAIVIPAWQRPGSLQRLLNCLHAAYYPEGEITLILSLEGECAKEVREVVEEATWDHGPIERIYHEKRLGLKAHILRCGDLSEKYGSVIVLEDDIWVTPDFYRYTQRALQEYGGHPQIAGVALYSYAYAENGFFPFSSLADGNDLYFLQAACSWGQAWTSAQWAGFRKFLAEFPDMETTPGYPDYLKNWADYSWKKHFTRYLHNTQKYFAYPRIAYSTPFAEGGISETMGNLWQVPLSLAGLPHTWPQPEYSNARYDAWFELEAELLQAQFPEILEGALVNDLHGTKNLPADSSKWVISTRKCAAPTQSWGLKMTPPEQNILFNIAGKEISLGRPADFARGNLSHVELVHKWNVLDQSQSFGLGEMSIGVMAHAGDDMEHKIAATLESIWANEVNGVEVILITPPGIKTPETPDGKLLRHIEIRDESKGSGMRRLLESMANPIGCIVSAGTQFLPDAFSTVSEIFEQIPEIGWLGEMGEGDPQRAILQDRWNPYLLSRKLKKGNMTFPVHFWRSTLRFRINLAEIAQSEVPKLAFWIELQKLTAHFTAAARFSSPRNPQEPIPLNAHSYLSSQNFPAHLTNTGKAGLLFPFYKWNILYLRFAFLDDGKLASVIRYDAHHGNWYKSRY